MKGNLWGHWSIPSPPHILHSNLMTSSQKLLSLLYLDLIYITGSHDDLRLPHHQNEGTESGKRIDQDNILRLPAGSSASTLVLSLPFGSGLGSTFFLPYVYGTACH